MNALCFISARDLKMHGAQRKSNYHDNTFIYDINDSAISNP